MPYTPAPAPAPAPAAAAASPVLALRRLAVLLLLCAVLFVSSSAAAAVTPPSPIPDGDTPDFLRQQHLHTAAYEPGRGYPVRAIAVPAGVYLVGRVEQDDALGVTQMKHLITSPDDNMLAKVAVAQHPLIFMTDERARELALARPDDGYRLVYHTGSEGLGSTTDRPPTTPPEAV